MSQAWSHLQDDAAGKSLQVMARHIPVLRHEVFGARQVVAQCLQRLHHAQAAGTSTAALASSSQTLRPTDWAHLLGSFSNVEYQLRLLNEDVDSDAAKLLRHYAAVPRVGRKRAAGGAVDDGGGRKTARTTTPAQSEALRVVPPLLSSMPYTEIIELDRKMQRASADGAPTEGAAKSNRSSAVARHNSSVSAVTRSLKRRMTTWHDGDS